MKDIIFQIITACQGAFVFGLSIVIFIHYIFSPLKDKAVQWHVVCVTLSYIFLTMATLVTVFMNYYSGFSIWHFFVFTSYLLGDISLITLFRKSIKKKLSDEHNKSRNR